MYAHMKPPRPEQTTMSRIQQKLSLIYYQYEVTSPAYVLTPGEKLVMNTIVLLIIGFIAMGVCSYILPLLLNAVCKLFWVYERSGPAHHMIDTNHTASLWGDLGFALKI